MWVTVIPFPREKRHSWHQGGGICQGGGDLYWPRLQVRITGPRRLLSCYTRQPAGKEVNYRGRRGMWWGYNTTGVGGDGMVWWVMSMV